MNRFFYKSKVYIKLNVNSFHFVKNIHMVFISSICWNPMDDGLQKMVFYLI